MLRPLINGYADAATNSHANGDLSKSEVPSTSSKNINSKPESGQQTLAIPQGEDDPQIRERYRPFVLEVEPENDWINELELDAVMDMADRDLQGTKQRLKVLVLYGSLRRRSYSRFVAFEASRILFRLGCDVRVYDPNGLPIKDDVQHLHEKVQELRELSRWSDGHVWISPEQHGNLTAVFKNQIDWIPLQTGSVRPTQGRTLAIGQVSGGSQSFNSVNSLRILGRWMRMFTIPNQSSIPMAYTQFSDEGQPDDQRLVPSGNRDRLVDCMEEFVKYTILMRPHLEVMSDRFSERMERRRREAKIREENALQLRVAPEREIGTDGRSEMKGDDTAKRRISITNI